MEPWVSPYASTVVAMGATAGLSLIQLVVADLVGVRARHTPGAPVTPDHGDLFFRATRAHANTNESIAVFILAALFGMLSAASPAWLGWLAWLYVAGRVGHMLCYYADLRIPRSACFGVAMLALLGMLVAGFAAWV